jgi:hypothetical protein
MKGPVSVSGIEGKVRNFTTQIPSYGDSQLESELEHDRVVVNDQKISFDWDIVQSATPLATLAAVLAGFVVLAIVAILTSEPTSGEKKVRYTPLIPFLGAFFTLALASFLFSVLAGSGPTGGGRLLPLTEAYFNSLIFGCGVVQMCVGIAWFMEGYVTSSVNPVRGTARWIVHVGVLLAAVATAGVLVQPLFVVSADELKGVVAWSLMAGLPIIAVRIGIGFRAAGDPDRLRDATYEGVVLALVATIGYGLASVAAEDIIRAWYGWVFIMMVVAQLLLCALIVAYEAALPLWPGEKGYKAVPEANAMPTS